LAVRFAKEPEHHPAPAPPTQNVLFCDIVNQAAMNAHTVNGSF
jgi:hypothetical protein